MITYSAYWSYFEMRLPWKLYQSLPGPAGIHRAGTETLCIYSYIGESQRLEDTCKSLKHLRGQRSRQLVCGNFNPGDFSMMSYPELPESQFPQRILSLLYRLQSLTGYRTAIFDA